MAERLATRFSVKVRSRTLLHWTSFKVAKSIYRSIKSFFTSSFVVGFDRRMPGPSICCQHKFNLEGTLMIRSVTSSISDNWTVSRFTEISSVDLSCRYGRIGGTSGIQSPIYQIRDITKHTRNRSIIRKSEFDNIEWSTETLSHNNSRHTSRFLHYSHLKRQTHLFMNNDDSTGCQ